MIKNYFKIAWRNLKRDSQFSLLNLLGLSTGLACALLIYLWVNDEMSIDKFHQNDARLFQVMKNIPLADGGIQTSYHTPGLLAKSLVEEIPGIEEVAVIKSPDEDENPTGILSFTNASIKAKEIFVTNNFFTLFSFQLIEGNKEKPFANNSSVLLSDQLAMKTFHTTQNIIGKTVSWDRGNGQSGNVNGVYTIAGVFETPPSNSSLQFDLLFPYELYLEKNAANINWHSSNPSTYVMLKDENNVNKVNELIRDFIRYKIKGLEKNADLRWEGDLFLQRFSDRYLYNQYLNGSISGGRIEYVKLFSIIAVFILIIACINFMNLSTAKASQRMKEVGIKKVVGANRSTLILQYISESMLMVFLSLAIAIAFIGLLFPAFKQITGKNIELHFNAGLMLSVIGIALVTGFVAGSYPAFYLSGFKPIKVLKGRMNISANESLLRRGLVIFQFTISVVLIVSVMVIHKQMNFIQKQNLGYNKDNVIRFANEGKLQLNQQAFLSELRNVPGVVNASGMEGDMLGNHSGGGGIDWPGKKEGIEFDGLYVDFNFMETMDLQMKEGRMFSSKYNTDSTGVIFNETAIAAMKLKDPVGKTISLWGKEAHIIGVMKDFHFESMYNRIGPFFLSFGKNAPNIIVRIKAGTEKQTLEQLKNLYKAYNPGLPFEYNFLDEDYQQLYASEERVAKLSTCFAGIAILISCLGLFGLAAFMAQKKQKEIGIRKVVGATVSNITFMLSKDFLKLVLISLLIAFLIAWWATNLWLQSFAYRVHVSIGIFLISGALVILITLLTISFQSIKAAIANPVKSLRTE